MKRQRIIVQGILPYKGNVLIAKRANPAKAAFGKFHLAGGHIEYGETPEEAIVREYKEEFDIAVKPIKPIRTFSYIFKESHTIGIVFILESDNIPENIKFDPISTSEIAWVNKTNYTAFIPPEDNDNITLELFFKNSK